MVYTIYGGTYDTHYKIWKKGKNYHFISTMFAACIAIVIGIPFVSKNMFNNDVGYYSISIRGTHVGAANTEEEVNVALANARLQLSQQA